MTRPDVQFSTLAAVVAFADLGLSAEMKFDCVGSGDNQCHQSDCEGLQIRQSWGFLSRHCPH